jgi:hypothetical protein
LHRVVTCRSFSLLSFYQAILTTVHSVRSAARLPFGRLATRIYKRLVVDLDLPRYHGRTAKR